MNKRQAFYIWTCTLGIALMIGSGARAQSSAPYTYPQATQQQCDDDTALWSLWQAIANPPPPPSPSPAQQINSAPSIFTNGNVVVAVGRAAAPAPETSSSAQTPPLFPLAAIEAALQAVPLSQPLMDPSDLDEGEEYFSPNNSSYMQDWNYDAAQFYPGSNQTGYWQEYVA